jgi:hypothetical protein
LNHNCFPQEQWREFIRFASIAQLKKADRYIEFLRAIDIGNRGIQLVSGADKSNPKFKSQWQPGLAEPNLTIKFANKSRNFGPQSSLSIRPYAGASGGTGTGHAGFRFVMLMRYIVFGPELNEHSY